MRKNPGIKFALFDAQARPLPRNPFWHGKVQGIAGPVPEYSDSGTAQQRIHLDHEHLRNVCLLGGQPRLFDCLEFSDEMATVDMLYDLAFLLMDLWHLQLANLANWTMNRYLDHTGMDAGFALLPFFMAVRHATRIAPLPRCCPCWPADAVNHQSQPKRRRYQRFIAAVSET